MHFEEAPSWDFNVCDAIELMAADPLASNQVYLLGQSLPDPAHAAISMKGPNVANVLDTANGMYAEPLKQTWFHRSSDLKTMFNTTERISREATRMLTALRRGALESTHGDETERNSRDVASITTSTVSSAADSSAPFHTIHQTCRWKQRFEELFEFHQEYGHCCVRSHWPQNAPLAQWVKRQRSQYKLKKEGKHSNMTNEREKALEDLGLVWDYHTVFWEKHLNDLRDFRDLHLHCNVPTKYPRNQQLAIWAKCQRRQFKVFTQGDRRSNMTLERISKLNEVGFVFNPRKMKRPT
jgi:hypothetical protein